MKFTDGGRVDVILMDLCALLRRPAVKTVKRMFACLAAAEISAIRAKSNNIRSTSTSTSSGISSTSNVSNDGSGHSTPFLCGGLLDTLRFSLVSDTFAQHEAFVQAMIPAGACSNETNKSLRNAGYNGAGAVAGAASPSDTAVRGDGAIDAVAAWVTAAATAPSVGSHSGSKMIEVPLEGYQDGHQEIGAANSNSVKQTDFRAPGSATAYSRKVGSRDTRSGRNSTSSTNSSKVDVDADPELQVVRATSTFDDPTATVKQEHWNLEYKAAGLTFGSMVGNSGGCDAIDANDADDDDGFYDKDTISAVKISTASLSTAPSSSASSISSPTSPPSPFTPNPRLPQNPAFQAAMSTAKAANPEVAAYVWDAALQLLGHPQLSAEPVEMIMELQLHLTPFLDVRKQMHCYTKLARADSLASLAQDCRKHALNPAAAYSREKDVAYAAAATAAAADEDRKRRAAKLAGVMFEAAQAGDVHTITGKSASENKHTAEHTIEHQKHTVA